MATEAKDAVQKAYQYLMTVATDAGRFSGFRVEEIKLNTDNNFLITLSYEVVGEFAFDKSREYKDFIVDSNNGNVLSMTIRKL